MDILHKEITCPYCRMGFGEYILDKEEQLEEPRIYHLNEDTFAITCRESNYLKQHIKVVDGDNIITFTQDVKVKLSQLREKFLNNPEDFDNRNCTLVEYRTGFQECMLFGHIEKLGECYDKSKIYNESRELYEDFEFNIRCLYEKGSNLKEALREFIIKKK